MVYIEDDPEIGATIKQSLESGFSVLPGDNFTVEIYGKVGSDLPLLEVWHFSVESTTESNANLFGNLADLKKTRFLERLGTLLKSIMVTTRLLPGIGAFIRLTASIYRVATLRQPTRTRGTPSRTTIRCATWCGAAHRTCRTSAATVRAEASAVSSCRHRASR